MSARDEVIAFLAERLDLPATRIHDNTHFTADLGLSSVNALELLDLIEQRFGLTISDQAARGLQRVGDLIALVDSPAPR